MTTHDQTAVAPEQPSTPPSPGAVSPVQPHRAIAWILRLAGLHALVNGVGFGAFTLPAAWHMAHDQTVWYALGKPTYGHGPFQVHGLGTTVPLLLAFFGVCTVLAVGGALLLVPRSSGVVLTAAGVITCAPFWWGFNLPLAWVNAAVITALLALASVVWLVAMLDPTLRARWDSGGRRTIEPLVDPTPGERHG
jgi:hypothetical protein